jgi:hypothetical protein
MWDIQKKRKMHAEFWLRIPELKKQYGRPWHKTYSIVQHIIALFCVKNRGKLLTLNNVPYTKPFTILLPWRWSTQDETCCLKQINNNTKQLCWRYLMLHNYVQNYGMFNTKSDYYLLRQYRSQSVNTAYRNNRCFFRDSKNKIVLCGL